MEETGETHQPAELTALVRTVGLLNNRPRAKDAITCEFVAFTLIDFYDNILFLG